MRTKFVVLEGGDGSGKTSVRKSLFQQLRAAGHDAVAILPQSWLDRRSTRVITALKFLKHSLPKNEITDAYLSDKLLLTQTLVLPQLQERFVICDRYVLSDIVYHDVIWGIPMEYSAAQVRLRKLLTPHISIVVDVDPEISLKRLQQRGAGFGHVWDTLEYQNRIRMAFENAITRFQDLIGVALVFDNSAAKESLDARVKEQLIPHLLC